SDNDDDMVWDTYVRVQCQRYLEPRSRVARPPDRLDWLLYELDDRQFKQEVRMSRQYFQDLLLHIENHPVFQNNSNSPQRPIHQQLLVALKRFGCFGNGAALGVIARFFNISGEFSQSYKTMCLFCLYILFYLFYFI